MTDPTDHEARNCPGRIDVSTAHDDGPVWVHGRCDTRTDGPRALLDDYAAADPADGDYGRVTRDQIAPKAFAGLRAVLDLHPADIHECVANDGRETYTAYEPECPTRRAITAALEAK